MYDPLWSTSSDSEHSQGIVLVHCRWPYMKRSALDSGVSVALALQTLGPDLCTSCITWTSHLPDCRAWVQTNAIRMRSMVHGTTVPSGPALHLLER